MTKAHQQVDLSFWNTSTASSHMSTSLLPLISRFEALDANSLVFNVKDAQPPHLRLPGSRMGRRSTREDPYQVKTIREKLLTLFERPGWGAETLRGLRDIDQSRGFDDVLLGQTREPSKTRNSKELNPNGSLGVPNDSDRNYPSSRPRHRRESIVKDRIRLFDGGMDFPPTSHKHAWKLSGTDIAVAPISPYRFRATVSPNKKGDFLISPPKIGHGTLAPKISLGYLRPNETTPRPWRPLDNRKWAQPTTPTNNGETPYSRQRPCERYEESLASPTLTNAAKRVQIIYQDPKRNVSEKVTVQCTPRSSERGQGNFENEIEEGHTHDVLSPYISAHLGCEPNTIEVASLCETRVVLGGNEVASLKRLKLPKESKVQDRIKLFSNEGGDMKSLGMASSRMRIQSTPTKLPSHTIYRVPSVFNDRVPYLNCCIRSQLLNISTKATEVVKPKNEGLCGQLQSVGGQPSKSPVQEPEKQALGPRRSSGMNDKIQRFETFVSSQAPSNQIIVVSKSRKRASSHSKRLQTWPRQTVESVPNAKSDEIGVTKKPIDPEYSGQEHDIFAPSAKSNSRYSKTEKIAKEIQDDQRAKYKIQSRQERLSRRSRSRSRSAPSISISEPKDQRDPESKHASEHSRTKRKKSKREATRALGIAVEIDSNNASSNGQHGGHDREEAVVVDTVVAQCELAEPRPLRLAETLRMIRLCRGRFGERSGTWRRKVRGSSEKGAALAV